MAILKPHEGKDQEMVAFLREFYSMMYAKQYSRDTLFRDIRRPGVFVHFRVWLSDEAREAAIQDPDVHRYWMTLPEYGTVSETHEELQPVFSTQEGIVEDTLETGA